MRPSGNTCAVGSLAVPPKQRAAGGIFGGLMDPRFHFLNVAGRYATKTLIDIHTININTMVHMYNSMHIIIRYYLVTITISSIWFLCRNMRYLSYSLCLVTTWSRNIQKHLDKFVPLGPSPRSVRDRHLRHHPEKLMYITGCAGSCTRLKKWEIYMGTKVYVSQDLYTLDFVSLQSLSVICFI